MELKKALTLAAVGVVVIVAAIVIILNINPIKLTAATVDLPVFSEVDFTTYLKENKINGDIVVDAKAVKLDTLGTYSVYYNYKNKTKELIVNVKDVTAPKIETDNIKVIVNKSVNLVEKIKVSDDYDKNPVVTIDDSKLDMTTKGTYDITVTVTSGTENLSVNYSPLSYMVRMYEKESTSDATKALVQALYGYYQAAVNYHAQ